MWRRYRDWFYVENMHGYDWEALRRQYAAWLPHVAHRSDLNYVISEMVSELTVQHAYVEGGDFELPRRPSAALPGARFAFAKIPIDLRHYHLVYKDFPISRSRDHKHRGSDQSLYLRYPRVAQRVVQQDLLL